MHLVPLGAWTFLHVPEEQAPRQQGSVPPGQARQAPPALPHLVSAVPTWQVKPSQQPLQHAPLRHTPPVHLVPSLRPELVHLPLAQVPEEQGLLVAEQSAQTPPPEPQAEATLPVLHTVPEQQPLQLLVGHVPLQPSTAPAHLPVQSGTHWHCPVTQVWLDLQVPQVPPQPSVPQSLPLQLAVHPEQEPPLQVLPWINVQSTHWAPDDPHWSSDVPVRQLVLSLLQHPEQVEGSQRHVPPSEHTAPSRQLAQLPPSLAPDDSRAPMRSSGDGVESWVDVSGAAPASGPT